MQELQKYYPMLADSKEGDFFEQENILMWDRFHKLPTKLQKILLSEEITDYIFRIEKKYHLSSDLEIVDFSVSIRKYFLQEISEKDFVYKIASLCRVRPEDAVQILRAILSIAPQSGRGEEVKKRNVTQITLANALSQFPAIKDQKISIKPIMAKPFLQPLQPSIKNWIMVYEKILGVSKHNAIERGEFVFRSEATKGLDQKEREELSVILRSRDEDTFVMIDMDQRKIVFDALAEKEKSKAVVAAPVLRKTVQFTQRTPVPQNPQVMPQKVLPQNLQTQKNVSSTQKMQSSTVVQNRYTQKPLPVQSALQQEIIKNRMEMDQGLDPVNFTSQKAVPEQNVIVSNIIKPIQGTLAVQGVSSVQNGTTQGVTAGRDEQQKIQSAVAGKINFSSNHNLPSEKSAKKELKSTSSYHISPIGGVHTLQNQK